MLMRMMVESRGRYAGVLFDLDGTLADTAPDLAAPVHAMRAARGLPPMTDAALRPFASMGARGLLKQGLGLEPSDAAFAGARDEFLRRYEQALCVHTQIFPGMAEVLIHLDAQQIPWGVVSNKVERYVRPLIAALGLAQRSRTQIGGDTAGFAKPHPAPLLLGAQQLGVAATAALYVGDDRRDIEAARAAGMDCVAAAYGYAGDGDPPQRWGADFVIEQPKDLLAVLFR